MAALFHHSGVRQSLATLLDVQVILGAIAVHEGRLQEGLRRYRFAHNSLWRGAELWSEVPIPDRGNSFASTWRRAIASLYIGELSSQRRSALGAPPAVMFVSRCGS